MEWKMASCIVLSLMRLIYRILGNNLDIPVSGGTRRDIWRSESTNHIYICSKSSHDTADIDILCPRSGRVDKCLLSQHHDSQMEQHDRVMKTPIPIWLSRKGFCEERIDVVIDLWGLIWRNHRLRCQWFSANRDTK